MKASGGVLLNDKDLVAFVISFPARLGGFGKAPLASVLGERRHPVRIIREISRWSWCGMRRNPAVPEECSLSVDCCGGPARTDEGFTRLRRTRGGLASV